MDNSTLKNIIDFLEKEENKKHKDRDTFIWKVKLGYPLTEEDLNFKGDLSLYKSKIKSLPKGLKVGGDLDLYESKIESLPEGLEVGWDLYLDYTIIDALPKGLQVKGSLNLSGTKITSLPKGLKVGGDLNIRGTELIIYSNDELRKMIEPGFIKGNIIR